MNKLLLGSLLVVLSSNALAENVISIHTNSWKSVPVTVDEEKHTYSVTEGYLMPEGDYYYTYSGYRCLKSKVDNAGSEPIMYNDADAKGHAIYCYPEK